MTEEEIDAVRGWRMLAVCRSMSESQYVLMRYSAQHEEWRVTVKFRHPSGCDCMAPYGCIGIGEHISASRHSMLLAVDRARQWLTAAQASYAVNGGRHA